MTPFPKIWGLRDLRDGVPGASCGFIKAMLSALVGGDMIIKINPYFMFNA